MKSLCCSDNGVSLYDSRTIKWAFLLHFKAYSLKDGMSLIVCSQHKPQVASDAQKALFSGCFWVVVDPFGVHVFVHTHFLSDKLFVPLRQKVS